MQLRTLPIRGSFLVQNTPMLQADATSIIIQHAMFRSFHILEFTFFDSPDKYQPATGAEAERQHYQYDQTFIHGV
jgi:hypothetical protein